MVSATELLRVEEGEDEGDEHTSDDGDGDEVVGWALLQSDCHGLLPRSMVGARLKSGIQDSLMHHLRPMRVSLLRRLGPRWAGW